MQTKHWLPSLPPSLSSSILSPLLSHQMYNFSSSKTSGDTASVMRNISKDDLVRFPYLHSLDNFQAEFFQAYGSCPLAFPYFWWVQETPQELPSPKCWLVGAGLAAFQKAKWPQPCEQTL